MKDKLSICIIVKDEEKNIGKCLESIKDISNEIIVFDTGSKDNTVSIIKTFGIIPREIEWEDDFSKMRNLVLEEATKPFILSIDADEVLINPNMVLEAIKDAKQNIGGWLVQIASPANPNTNHIYFGRHVRLFRNVPNIKFKGLVHEQIATSIQDSEYKIADSKIMINHRGYLNNSEMKEKHKRNLAILLEAHAKEPENPNYYFYAGRCLSVLGEYETAISMFKNTVALIDDENPMLQLIYNQMAQAYYNNNDYDNSIIAANKSLDLQKHQVHAYLTLGDALFAKGDYKTAHTNYKKILVYQDIPKAGATNLGDYYIHHDEIYYKSGKAALKDKNYETAATDFKNGLKINPSDIKNTVGLANVQFKLRNFHEARETLSKALKMAPKNQEILEFYEQVNQIIAPTMQSKDEKVPTLSICMIVKNEEENLPRCLESINPIADEIIIVDTGSTDRTKEIAKQHNAKIFDFQWCDDFSAARNISLMHATMDWILYIDADEKLDPASGQDLKYLLSMAKTDIGAILCIIEGELINSDGTKSSQRGAYPRLFRNYGYPAIKFTGSIHEQITPSLKELKKEMLSSNIIIHHYGYDISPELLTEKLKRNYNLLITQIDKEPKNAYAWHQLGQTLGKMQLNKEAEDALSFAHKLGTLSNSIDAVNSTLLAHYAGIQKNYEGALTWTARAIKLADDFLYPHYLRAYTLLYLNRYEEAEKEFIIALKLSESKRKISTAGFELSISRKEILDGYEKAQKVGK